MQETSKPEERRARASSWTYRATRAVAVVSLRLFYRRIATLNREHLPAAGPLVIAANHPNYMIDPLAIGSRTRRQLHFVAKGPLLDRYPLVSRFLRGAGVVPVFRLRETPAGGGAAGRTTVNRESFERCADLLEEDGVICMFAEGESHPERQVRELRSGTARIVLEAEARNDYALGVQVIPAGLYFPDVDRYFSDGAVAFGAPIETGPYRAQHATDPLGAVRALTAEIQRRLRDLAVHVPDPAWVRCVEQVADFANGWPESAADAGARLQRTREVSTALQAFQAADEEGVQRFRRSAELLWVAADAWHRHGRGREHAQVRVRDAVALPVATFGYVYNMPPYLLLRGWIALFVRSREKRAFVKFMLGLPLFVGWYAVTARVVTQRRPAWAAPMGATLAAAGPVIGFLAMRMRSHRGRWLDAWRAHTPEADAAWGAEIALRRAALLRELAPWLPDSAAAAGG